MKIIERIFKINLISKLENQVDAALKRCDDLELEISKIDDLSLQNRVLKLYINNDDEFIEIMDIVEKFEKSKKPKIRREDSFENLQSELARRQGMQNFSAQGLSMYGHREMALGMIGDQNFY